MLQKYYAVSDSFYKEKQVKRYIPKSSKLEFLEKFLPNNFALSDTEENTSGPLNRGGIADLPLMRTILAICQKSWEPSFWEAMNSCFISICKFGNLKNSFAMITIQSELYFQFRRSTLLIQKKKRSLWTMEAAQAAENHRDERGLTWYLRWGIYTSIPTRTQSQNLLAAAEALSLKISSYWTSLKWS